MREQLHSTTPDTLPSRLLNPTDMGSVAAVVTIVELPETPEVDVEQLELERRKNTAENLRALQKRFGERFVKGSRMEGGGFTGGAARELLAGFMDQPGFADKLKRLIPGRHGALQLLKDNHAYIQSTLEQLYKDDPTHERAPAKDPYELARSVGYELTGPFESTSEFVLYDKLDFPPGQLGRERLCTFNNPTERLRNYHILWLRHAEVADTLPANELTQDNLSEAWKTYLKTIGRYDEASSSYDLTRLSPAREDPYGISSMSVQISRDPKARHVSIKNRYNHTVVNPDNTLGSNLDNVAYGLRQAVYTLVGREDLMSDTTVAHAEGYVVDNESGIHAYAYEEDNVYYGDYEYIKNGVVTTIDRGKYDMISPQLYIPKSGKGDELRLGQRSTDSIGLDVGSDVKFLYASSKKDEKDPRVADLRRAYAERDHAELVQMLSGELMAQARAAYDVYRDTAATLSRRRGLFSRGSSEVMTEAAFVGLLERKEAEWRENGVIDYLVHELVEKSSRPNLVATPNVLADWRQIRALGVDFGKDQPYATYVDDDFLGQYSAEELSGTLADGPVRLSIIPSAYNLEVGTVEEQRQQLGEKQVRQPQLNFRVPSMLDGVMLWRTLRARGATVDFDATCIRHFDAPARRDDGGLCVPRSFVDSYGMPILAGRRAFLRDLGLLSVG